MSILNVAYSGLLAFQRALDVTGNNISNALTRGYSRQSIQFNPGLSTRFGQAYLGSGVDVGSIYRNIDQFANAQVRNTTSIKSQYDSFYQQALQIDKLLSQEGSNVSTAMQSFFDALGQLNTTPDSIAARNVLFFQSKTMVGQFNSLQTRLDEYQNNSSAQMTEAVNQINKLTTNIAEINQQIMTNREAPDLLDQRDVLIEQLSQLIDTTVVDQGDGLVNVSIGSGEMLVAGTSRRDLKTVVDLTHSAGTKIFLSSGSGQVDITDKLNSGTLGGLLSYEKEVICKASQLVGQMAIGLAQKFNAQHALGMDMNNQTGKNYFNDFNAGPIQLNRSTRAASNTGTAVLSVAISDVSQIKPSDYELVVSDASSNELRLIRKSDGSSTTLNWTSNPPSPPGGQVVFDGMTIQVNNLSQLANQDHFTLAPTRGAARDLALALDSSLEIALASPVKSMASISNTGTGQINIGQLYNTAGVNKDYRIDFISATQYNLVNETDNSVSGPFAFSPNTTNTIQIPDATNPSYTLLLSGIPQSGDQFRSGYNAGGFGDNRNGLNLAGIQQNKFFSEGSEGLFDRYANLLSHVGSQTNQAKIRADSAEVLYKQAVEMQQNHSGVNLDEEAANLLRFKQAYEAAGKLVEVSGQIMNILFDMMR